MNKEETTNDNICQKYGFEYPRCGVSIDKGWLPIVESLFQTLVLNGHKVKFDQIKQKFGRLTIYFHCPNNAEYEKVKTIVREAEKITSRTCESCGNKGKERSDRWIRIMCNECNEIYLNRFK